MLSVCAQDLPFLAHCFPCYCTSNLPILLPGLPNMSMKIMKAVPILKSTTCAQISCLNPLQQVPQLAAPALSQPVLVQQAVEPYLSSCLLFYLQLRCRIPRLTPTVLGYPCAGEEERQEKPPTTRAVPLMLKLEHLRTWV